MPLGDFEITALSDGAYSTAANNINSPAISPVNGFLVDTHDKLVLIDTGAKSQTWEPAGEGTSPAGLSGWRLIPSKPL